MKSFRQQSYTVRFTLKKKDTAHSSETVLGVLKNLQVISNENSMAAVQMGND